VTNLVFGGFTAAVYSHAYTHWRVGTMDPAWVPTWILGYLLYEFIHYWNHRLGHTVNVLWADHSQHHSSEEMNFSVAGRLPPFGFWWQLWFFLPMAVLGFPPAVYAVCVFVAIPYQYWLHSRVLTRRLGWLEYVINTPANHRVHHAQNDLYIDKNMGASLMIFDHLFGTYQRERDDEPCVYGVRHALADWNPIVAVVKPYAELWHDARRARSWRDKLRLWFMPTGWRPADVAAAAPYAASDPRRFERHPEKLPRALRRYVVAQSIAYAAVFLAGAATYATMASAARALWVAVLVGSLAAIGGLLNDARRARRVELARHAIVAAASLAAAAAGAIAPAVAVTFVLLAAASAAWLRRVPAAG
jgi:hypothetical protein